MPEATATEKRDIPWKRYVTLAVLGIVLLLFAYLLAVAFLPRWWAHRIGDLAGGRFSRGTGWGLFYGIVFTFVPLLVLRQAFRDVSWKVRGILLAAAVVLATPNLLTLGVVLGTGKAAHAGERILDVEAPAFRAASLVGAIGATVVAVGAFVLLSAGRRDTRKLKELKSEQQRQAEESTD